MDFSRLLDKFQNNYYSELLMFIAELLAIIIGLLYVRKEKVGQFFIAYIAFDLSILLADWYLIVDVRISKNFNFYFHNTTNTIVAYVELLVYYNFFIKILDGPKIKKILTTLSLLYSLIIILFITTKFSFITNRYGYVAYIIGATEFVFLLAPCVYYFLQLLKFYSTVRLAERPSYWIVTGIFFYSLISIPYYLLNIYFSNTQHELRFLLAGLFYYIPFTANFIFLIKAFLCKKLLTI